MASYFVTVDGIEYKVDIGSDGSVAVNGGDVATSVVPLGGASFSVLVGTASHRFVAERCGSAIRMLLRSRQYDVVVESEREKMLRRFDARSGVDSHRTEIHAPMPALIVRVEVSVGDDVKEGQGLLVLEAMKMENEIKAHCSGRIKSIYVEPRKAVEKGELLLVIE